MVRIVSFQFVVACNRVSYVICKACMAFYLLSYINIITFISKLVGTFTGRPTTGTNVNIQHGFFYKINLSFTHKAFKNI